MTRRRFVTGHDFQSCRKGVELDGVLTPAGRFLRANPPPWPMTPISRHYPVEGAPGPSLLGTGEDQPDRLDRREQEASASRKCPFNSTWLQPRIIRPTRARDEF